MSVNESDARIQKLLGLITQGEWKARHLPTNVSDGCDHVPCVFGPNGCIADCECGHHDNDAEFIALVRNRIGSLYEERELNESLTELENEVTKSYKEQLAQSQAQLEVADVIAKENADAYRESQAEGERLTGLLRETVQPLFDTDVEQDFSTDLAERIRSELSHTAGKGGQPHVYSSYPQEAKDAAPSKQTITIQDNFLDDLRGLAERYGLELGGGGDFLTGNIKVGFKPKSDQSQEAKDATAL